MRAFLFVLITVLLIFLLASIKMPKKKDVNNTELKKNETPTNDSKNLISKETDNTTNH